MKKRFLILILTVCLLFSAVPLGTAAEETITVEVPVSVSVTNATGIDLNIRLNPLYATEAVLVNHADALSDAVCIENVDGAKLKVAIASASAITFDGILFYIRLTLSKQAQKSTELYKLMQVKVNEKITYQAANAILLDGVEDGATYDKATTIFFNEGTATLNGVDFASGSTVTKNGDYSLVLTDTNGKTRTVAFSVLIPRPEYAFSQNVQIGLVEPWFLRANAKTYVSGDETRTAIDYDTDLDDYGFYFVRESKLGIEGATAENVTAEQIAECGQSVRYSKTNGKAHVKDGYVYADFDEGLYTYELSDSIFTAFFIEYDGKTVFANVRERNLKELVDTYKEDGVGDFTDEERTVFSAMSNMANDITAYRAQFEDNTPLDVQKAPTLAENPLGAETENTPYTFSRNYQVVLIEPWGVGINGKVKLNDTVVDYNTMQDYGVVVYYDVSDTYSSMDTATLLACDDAYVFSSRNGDAALNGEYIHAVYNKNIYTYQMSAKAYVMFYVLDADGSYHYSAVKEKTIKSAIEEVLEISTSQLEKNVLQDMIVLYRAVVDYRASLR